MINLKTLVLNPNYLPVTVFPELYTIPAEDAIVRYLNGSADVIYWHDRQVLTPSRSDLQWPSVLVNRQMRSFKKEVKLKKSTLYYRDQCVCQYCGNEISMNEMTYDHVKPRSRGGQHAWDNVVLSCIDCNTRKGDKEPKGEFFPRKKPKSPDFFELLESRKKFPVKVYDHAWEQFLPGFTKFIYVGPKEIKNVKDKTE